MMFAWIAAALLCLPSASPIVDAAPSGAPAPERPVILYDEALSTAALERLVAVGGRRLFIVYQDDCGPETKRTGNIDVSRLARFVADRPGAVLSEWGVLHFETPLDEWIVEGPDSAHSKQAIGAWTSAMVRAGVQFGDRVGRKLPVVPFVSSVYQTGGGSRIQSVLPPELVDQCTIEPILSSGGAGVCIWSAGSYVVSTFIMEPKDGMGPNPDSENILRHWSEDLGKPVPYLRSPGGSGELWGLFGDATASLAERFSKAWSASAAKPPQPPSPAPPAAGKPAQGGASPDPKSGSVR
jgi:hypothetical protein